MLHRQSNIYFIDSFNIYETAHEAIFIDKLIYMKKVETTFVISTPSSLLSDSNQRPRDYKSRALAN